MFVTELKELNIIPEYITDILDTHCIGIQTTTARIPCNYKIGINESLGSMYCTNPKCPCKLLDNIEYIVKVLNLQFIRRNDIAEFIRDFGITSPLQIFAYEYNDGVFSERLGKDYSEEIEETVKKKCNMSLGDYISLLKIPELEGFEYVVTENYNFLETFFEKLLEGNGVIFIQEKLDNYYRITKERNSLKEAEKILNEINRGNTEELKHLSEITNESNMLKIAKDILEGGISYIVKLLSKNNKEYTEISSQAFNIFYKLIGHKDELFEGLDYVNLLDLSSIEIIPIILTGIQDYDYSLIKQNTFEINSICQGSSYVINYGEFNDNIRYIVNISENDKTLINYLYNKEDTNRIKSITIEELIQLV